MESTRESTRLVSAAFSLFPQIRSQASQTTITASRTASSYMRLPTACLPLLLAVPLSSLMPCFRWCPVIANEFVENSPFVLFWMPVGTGP